MTACRIFFPQPITGHICDKRGLAWASYPSAAFEALAILPIAFSGNLWIVLVAAVCKSLGSGTARLSIQAECTQLEPLDRNGAAMAMFIFGTDVG